MVLGEGFVQDLGGVLVQAGEDLAVGAGHAGRGFAQALAVRVLPYRKEQLTHRCLRPVLVKGGASGNVIIRH